MNFLKRMFLVATLSMLFSCATNPGRMILPDSKQLAIGYGFNLDSTFLPGVYIDLRSKLNENFEVGSSMSILATMGGWGVQISPYVVNKIEVSKSSYSVLNASLSTFILIVSSNGSSPEFKMFFSQESE